MQTESQPAQDGDYLIKVFGDQEFQGLRQSLENAREEIMSSAPLNQFEWQKYSYWIALPYDREGQQDQAIVEFYKVLTSSPQTIWWSLAQNHLEQNKLAENNATGMYNPTGEVWLSTFSGLSRLSP